MLWFHFVQAWVILWVWLDILNVRLNTENISESGMNNLLTYSFGYYPLEQKMLWDKFLNWSDRKKNQTRSF